MESLALRMPSAELDALRERAQREGLTLSAFVRRELGVAGERREEMAARLAAVEREVDELRPLPDELAGLAERLQRFEDIAMQMRS